MIKGERGIVLRKGGWYEIEEWGEGFGKSKWFNLVVVWVFVVRELFY